MINSHYIVVKDGANGGIGWSCGLHWASSSGQACNVVCEVGILCQCVGLGGCLCGYGSLMIGIRAAIESGCGEFCGVLCGVLIYIVLVCGHL